MPSEELRHWVRRKRRNSLLLCFVNAAVALLAGSIILFLTFGVLFLFLRIVFLLLVPAGAFWLTLVAALAAAIGIALLCADARGARRDEMAIIPLWILREIFHIGPRALFEGVRNVARVHRLLKLDAMVCAELLAYIARRNRAVSKTELEQRFPGIDAGAIMRAISVFDGVLLLRRDRSMITLTVVLRHQLRNLLPRTVRVEIPKDPEPEPASVEPEKLTPHEVLGVPPGASLSEIKLAYRKRIKECHPDLFAGMDDQTRRLAEQWTKAINGAYEVLAARSDQRRPSV